MKEPKSTFTLAGFLGQLFNMPDNSGKKYAPGWQPYSPGNSSTPGWSGGMDFMGVPWPTAVPSLNALASDPGTPRARAILPDVNRYAFLPTNDLFISGIVGKSQG
ncbi:MAG TPA: hypothetical protein VJM50_16840 [Pyrinomonadaceae bacterium]|nr:hypothetical protein [Pyrinomonadaceae bacterium]